MCKTVHTAAGIPLFVGRLFGLIVPLLGQFLNNSPESPIDTCVGLRITWAAERFLWFGAPHSVSGSS